MDSVFKFAQLSDLHISSPGFPAPWQLANKRILGYLSWLKKRRFKYHTWIADLALEQLKQQAIDHYVITGDLTHIGLHREFLQIKQWLSKINPPNNVTVIPGNHDLYVDSKWHKSFIEWQDYMSSHEIKDETNSEIITDNSSDYLNNSFPILRVCGNILFIGMSSVYAAPWFKASGLVNHSQLDRLKHILSDPRWNNFCRILLIHHPITLTHTSLRKALVNRDELQALLIEKPVHLILHGHGHESTLENLSCVRNINTPIIGSASSSTNDQSTKRNAEYLLYEVSQKDTNWNIAVKHFNLDLNQKKFIQTNQHLFAIPKIAA